MGVAEHLRYFGGKDNVGDKTVSSLYESLLAAVYLDGGIEAARAFLRRHPLLADGATEQNYKGALQEYLQKNGKDLPTYDFRKEGQDNAPTFYCSATAQGETGTGVGATKRAAEQQAASKLLTKLKALEKGLSVDFKTEDVSVWDYIIPYLMEFVKTLFTGSCFHSQSIWLHTG